MGKDSWLQIRDQEELKLDDKITVSDKELKMGRALIRQYAEPLNLYKYKDRYHTELMNIIGQKAKGKRPTIKKLKPVKAKGDDLYNQLMSSLSTKKGIDMMNPVQTTIPQPDGSDRY